MPKTNGVETTLLKPAELKQCYLKMGMYGDAGTGKTYTASLVALGLHKLIGSTKPIAFFDTETGSEYVLPTLFEPEGVKLISVKSRAFTDLVATLQEASQASDILIVDSITQVWIEIMESYKRKNNLEYVEFQDWQKIKQEWNAFTTDYLNATIHVIVCGRSKDMWDYETNDRGKKELIKTGTRMATEKNLAYEPSLLVELEKILIGKKGSTGQYLPRAWILKDRFSQIDGKCFDKPTFDTFLPHIRMLNLGGTQEGVDLTRNSDDLFTPDNLQSRVEYARRRDIALEEIKDEIETRWPGMTGEQKAARIAILKDLFGTSSKTAIENMKVEVLEAALKQLRTSPAVTAEAAS